MASRRLLPLLLPQCQSHLRALSHYCIGKHTGRTAAADALLCCVVSNCVCVCQPSSASHMRNTRLHSNNNNNISTHEQPELN